MKEEILYKPSSKKQVSLAYGVSFRTLKLWLEPIEGELGKYVAQQYTPMQVKKIVNFLGVPEKKELILA